MRVLHVIGPLRTGGAQTQLLGLVKAAHGKFWDATVVATSGGALAREFAALECPFEELRRLGSPGLLRMRRLRQIVSDGEFDVVHGNLWQSNLYCRAAVAGRRNRPRVVISERNVEPERSFIRRFLDARAASVTDAYVGNTNAVGEFIRDVHPISDQLVAVIPNAVDRSTFRPRPPRDDRGRRTTVGSVGRLDPEKGFDVLIEATRLLSQRFPLEVRIVGEGPSLQTLRSSATGLPITFVGSLPPGPDIACFLHELDVFVLPSTYREGRPNVVLEAIAAGRPVVATNLSGLEEILSSEALVPPGDPVALATAIESAASDPDGWRARSDATPVLGFEELAREYLKIFEFVAEAS